MGKGLSRSRFTVRVAALHVPDSHRYRCIAVINETPCGEP
jgi:hypothetical protein